MPKRQRRDLRFSPGETPRANAAALTLVPRYSFASCDRKNTQRLTPHNPRPLTERERYLIELYSNCQLQMTPQQFYAKWKVTQPELALICYRSLTTVQRWFSQGRNAARPTHNDLHHLALMDFLLEHFEEIPETLLNLLCPRR